MNQNPKTVAIYATNKNIISYVKEKYNNIICLYDNIYNTLYIDIFPKFHYTEINNLHYDIIIDDLKLIDRLKNKNNRIIYYLDDPIKHNLDYKIVQNLLQEIDCIIVNNIIPKQLIESVYNYKKDVLYV